MEDGRIIEMGTDQLKAELAHNKPVANENGQ